MDIYDLISIRILNKALKNNRDNGQDYFYISINTTYANIDFSLTLLAFTLDLTFILNQSFILVSDIKFF